MEQLAVNGHPAARVLGPEGEVLSVLTLDVVDGHIRKVRNQLNPEKLRHLGPVGDLTALMAGGPVSAG